MDFVSLVLTDRESLNCSILYWTIKSAWVELRTSYGWFQNNFHKIEYLVIFIEKTLKPIFGWEDIELLSGGLADGME